MVKKYQFKVDLLHPDKEMEARKHKLKRLVQSPNSYFQDVKCRSCQTVTTIFSHASSSIICPKCGSTLCTSTGGKAHLTTGVRFRRKPQ